MLSRLMRRYRVARLMWHFLVHEELRSQTPVPLLKRIEFVRRGFLSQWWDKYNLTDYALEDYFSDWAKAPG